MARPRKAAAAEKPPKDEGPDGSFNKTDFIRDLDEVIRQKANASEYSGMAGQAVKQCAEKSDLHRKAVGIGAWLKTIDAAKRTAFVADLDKVIDALGYRQEPTLFGTPAQQAAEAKKAAAEETAAPPPPPPPEADPAAQQVKNNVRQLRGIKKLEGADAGGSYQVNG